MKTLFLALRLRMIRSAVKHGDVVITDLSGADGNGVTVNGKRVGEGRLKSGDVIGIGEVTLKFDARPI